MAISVFNIDREKRWKCVSKIMALGFISNGNLAFTFCSKSQSVSFFKSYAFLASTNFWPLILASTNWLATPTLAIPPHRVASSTALCITWSLYKPIVSTDEWLLTVFYLTWSPSKPNVSTATKLRERELERKREKM